MIRIESSDLLSRRDGRALFAVLAAIFVGLIASPAGAQSGSLDPAFGSGGIAEANFPSPKGSLHARAHALQPDGRIVAVGCAGSSSPPDCDGFDVARFNADGTLDRTFSGDGMVSASICTDKCGGVTANAVTVQRDGKIVVAGCFLCERMGSLAKLYPESSFALARFNRDGTLDTSFGRSDSNNLSRSPGTVVTSFGGALTPSAAEAFGVATGKDGVIFAGGTDWQAAAFAVARYSPDGRLARKRFLDYSGRFAFALTIQDDGKLLMGGDRLANGNALIARLHPDLTSDKRFGQSGWAELKFDSNYRAVKDIAVGSNGRPVVVGHGSGPNSSGEWCSLFAVGRLTTGGTADASFGKGGVVKTAIDECGGADALSLRNDGSIAVVGQSWGGRGQQYRRHLSLVHYLANGALDAEFGAAGVAKISVGGGRDLAVQRDGKYVVGAGTLIRVIDSNNPLLAGGIAGTVRDESHAALVNAQVDCGSGGGAFTWGAGDYAIATVPSGTYECTAKLPGYTWDTRTVFVELGLTSDVHFHLAKLGQVAGRVTNAANKAALSGSLVECSAAAVVTWTNGTYFIPQIAPGTHRCSASKAGFVSTAQVVVVQPGLTSTANFALVPTGTIAGSVTASANGLPISGAAIDCGAAGRATSATIGDYTVTNVAPDSYTCTASKAGYVTATRTVTVQSGKTTTANFRLQRR